MRPSSRGPAQATAAAGTGTGAGAAEEDQPSAVAQRGLAIFRKVERDEAKISRLVAKEEQLIARRLEHRYKRLNETSRIEEERSRHLVLNSEVKEQIVLEVDAALATKQQAVATRQYAARQLDLNMPAWLKTVTETVGVVRSCGHSNKLRWRSKALALLKRCILESEDDPNGVESRIRLRRIVLEINNHAANELVRHLEALKGDFINDMITSDSKLGHDSSLLQAAKAFLEQDSESIVPLSRSGWSSKLDESTSAKSAAQSGQSFSTVSRPITLSESVISAAFEPGTGSKLLPPVMTQLSGGGVGAGSVTSASALSGEGDSFIVNGGGVRGGAGGEGGAQSMPATGAGAAGSPSQRRSNPLRGIPSLAERGAIRGNVHPPCHNEEQAQAVLRMRSSARTGNFTLCRSIFVHNFDPPEAVRQGKLSVARIAPTLQPFLSLMVAFKNAPELRFEDAFEVMDLIVAYGLVPDVTIYNVLMRACERESRWRRALAIYRDMMELHKVIPNVQTFDVIIDCCRHSLEEPAVIFDELRRHKLPREYCYKAALCNCGNRIPQQTLYESMYDISLAELPPHIKKMDTRGDGHGNREEGIVYPADELHEKVKEYQWNKLKNVIKSTLPSKSPVRNAVPADPLRAFNVQLARSLPFESIELASRASLAASTSFGGNHLGSLSLASASLGHLPPILPSPNASIVSATEADTPAMIEYKRELMALDQPSWVSDVEGGLGPNFHQTQLSRSSPNRSLSPSPSPSPGPTSKAKKKTNALEKAANIALLYEKVMADEAEAALVASMSSEDEEPGAHRRGSKGKSKKETVKYSRRTRQPFFQKPLAKLPKAEEIMRGVQRSIEIGEAVSVLQNNASDHKATVLLKKT